MVIIVIMITMVVVVVVVVVIPQDPQGFAAKQCLFHWLGQGSGHYDDGDHFWRFHWGPAKQLGFRRLGFEYLWMITRWSLQAWKIQRSAGSLWAWAPITTLFHDVPAVGGSRSRLPTETLWMGSASLHSCDEVNWMPDRLWSSLFGHHYCMWSRFISWNYVHHNTHYDMIQLYIIYIYNL